MKQWRQLSLYLGSLLLIMVLAACDLQVPESVPTRIVGALPERTAVGEQPAPEQPAPEQPAPEQPAPEQPTLVPEQPAPEQPTLAPEQPTLAPEQPTLAPAPEQPTQTPSSLVPIPPEAPAQEAENDA